MKYYILLLILYLGACTQISISDEEFMLSQSSKGATITNGTSAPITPNSVQFQTPQLQTASFQQFKATQFKVYNSNTQQNYRMLVYQANLAKINQHNTNVRVASATNFFSTQGFTMTANQFADLTQQQFRQIYTMTYPTNNIVKQKAINSLDKSLQAQCGCQPNNTFRSNSTNLSASRQLQLDAQIKSIITTSENYKLQSVDNPLTSIVNPTISSVIDQTNIVNQASTVSNSITNTLGTKLIQANSVASPLKGRGLQAVLEQNVDVDWTFHAGQIKYQGLCGACYAFSAADAVASMNSIFKFGFFVPLSIQQIIDCSSNGLTFGCSGGFLQGSFAFIQSAGITTDYAYPYKAKKQNCKIQKGSFKIASYQSIQQGSCNSVITELKKKPVAIGIAGYRLQFYSTGVFDDCNSYIDHAVLLIGYKSNFGWKIKNSWGNNWGMSGYAWIKDGNNCGICANAVTASISQQAISAGSKQ